MGVYHIGVALNGGLAVMGVAPCWGARFMGGIPSWGMSPMWGEASNCGATLFGGLALIRGRLLVGGVEG